MGRAPDRVDWGPALRVLRLVWWPIGFVVSKLSSAKIKPTDSGIFDPYVPLGSLKQLRHQYPNDLDEVPDDDPIHGGVRHASESDRIEVGTQSQRSFFVLKSLTFLIAATFAFRLISLQVTQGQENFQLAKGNATRSQIITAPRGIIYDSSGISLVSNVPSFSVVLNLTDLPAKAAERREYVSQLSLDLGLDLTNLTAEIEQNSKKKKDQIVLIDNISRDQALSLELKLNGVTGVDLITTPNRQYSPDIPGLGHLLGYVGKLSDDEKKKFPLLVSIGKSGLELQYDQDLQGAPGQDTYEVDSKGTRVRQLSSQPPLPGKSLVLGLDSSLQKVAVAALEDTIQKNHATNGAAVVIDVRNGSVLAMASAPTFDNNLFSPSTNSEVRAAILSNPLSPLLNRAIAGQYPSGSTIKPIYAAAALQEGVINASTRIDTSAGEITIGSSVYHDWRTHGMADVKQAIAESNNIFFYTIGGGHGSIGGLGINRIDSYLSRFNFGELTGIDLPGEKDGNVPTPEWLKKTYNEKWYLGDTYNLSIGQGGLLITPLQLASAVGSIANGGKLYQPKMVRSIVGGNGVVKDITPVVERDGIVKPEVLDTVRQGMRQTVTSGSAAQTFRTFPVEIAAKTGTAQVTQSLQSTHAWFTAFAPYSSPEIAIAVIVEGGGEGWAVAAPVAKNIFEQYFHLPLSPINPAPVEE